MNVPDRVYHYTSYLVAIEHILPSRKIRIGSLGTTNDPRETREWGFSVFLGNSYLSETIELDALLQLQNLANRIRREEWWVLCTTQNDTDVKNRQLESLGLTHFKYGYAHPRMWSSYGEGHKGICLELEGAELHSAVLDAVDQNHVFCGAVTYADEWDSPCRERVSAFQLNYADVFQGGEQEGLRNHIRSFHKAFFLEKSRDWATESEYRWLVQGTSGPYFVDISKALRSVIVGVDFPVHYGPKVWSLCDDLGVGVERMYWNNRVPTKQVWSNPVSSPTARSESEAK